MSPKAVRRQNKQPIQLDLFVPHVHDYEFKVIVTNQTLTPRAVVEFHEGRGAQEGVFAELKSYCQMEYIPVRKETGNQTWLLAAVLAHNPDSRAADGSPTDRSAQPMPSAHHFGSFASSARYGRTYCAESDD